MFRNAYIPCYFRLQVNTYTAGLLHWQSVCLHTNMLIFQFVVRIQIRNNDILHYVCRTLGRVYIIIMLPYAEYKQSEYRNLG